VALDCAPKDPRLKWNSFFVGRISRDPKRTVHNLSVGGKRSDTMFL
jgi:hypothetical protein